MLTRIIVKRLAGLVALVVLPLALLLGLDLRHIWPCLVSAGQCDLAREVWLRLAALGVAAGGAVVGGLLWQRRLDRQVDFLLESCQRMALGEPGVLPDMPQSLDELGRLSLAVQVLREALVDYLSLYRRFFDAAPDMFVSLAPHNEAILDANQAFCRAVGQLKSEVVGKPVSQFVNLDQPWNQVLSRSRGLLPGKMDSVRGMIEVEASVSLEQAPGGQIWAAGVMLRDVSQTKRLVDELVRKSAALERALEEIKGVENLKDQFLTTLSHELKTPLVSLKGFLQLIIQQRVNPEEQTEYLQVCWRNLLKMERQINNLLELARLSNFKDQYPLTPIDLAALIRTEAENLVLAAQEKQVRIVLDQVPPGPVMIKGHSEKMIQLLDNLLLNAIKYNVTNGRVEVALSQRDAAVVLTVADSGKGIARENMAKIFNRFYRADVSGTGRLEGLGIGLSLVQEIVKLHQGDIEVESEPGKGTVFTLILEAAS